MVGFVSKAKDKLMPNTKRIFIVSEVSHQPVKMFRNQSLKLAKGFIRLGNDVRIFSYFNVLMELSRFKSRTFAGRFSKASVDKLLAKEIANYAPDIVYIRFVRVLNPQTLEMMRQAAPKAVFIGFDNDAWPERRGERVNIAKKLDILLASNNGSFLQIYRDAGVPLCSVFAERLRPGY
jgi:hypothetical protein